jgi:murein L,D-transpeptidase YcbB/YkuD
MLRHARTRRTPRAAGTPARTRGVTRAAGTPAKVAALALLSSLLLVCSAGGAGRIPDDVGARARRQNSGDLLRSVSELLRVRIEAAAVGHDIAAGGALVHAETSLQNLYENRGFNPMWIAGSGPSVLTDSLLAYVRTIGKEGLRPSDYHLAVAERGLAAARMGVSAGTPDVAQLVDLELLLTDAYLLCASHSLAGRLNPETIDPEWFAARRGADFAHIADQAVSSGRVRRSLEELLPRQPGYASLRDALARYRSVAESGGWPEVPEGPTLKPGESGARVADLRTRLEATGDVEVAAGARDSFDVALEAAVRRFQGRHGLEVDGAVGRTTLAALNVSAADRADQIAVNMERWRWLPESMGPTHVLVNIAAFSLEAVRDDTLSLMMKVIVGRTYRRTPVFSDRITYMVLNPSWEVPDRIAVADVLIEARKDSTYFQRMGMRVLRGWGESEVEVDPSTVDWPSVPTRPFPFRFRQNPGPANALGAVKFMFPNKFNVYMHDTPARGLFAKADRAFSSGCIRVERPLDLAGFLMHGDARWSRERISSAMGTGSQQTVLLPEPVPIHVTYSTAWVDDDGEVQFRGDIYERDAPVRAALAEPPPEADDVLLE